MGGTITAPRDAVPAAPAAADRVVHYELSWGRYLACTLRRPPRLLVFELAWALVLCGLLVVLWSVELPLPASIGPLANLEGEVKVLATAGYLVGVLMRLYRPLLGVWIAQGGLDRVARVQGRTLTIGDGPTARRYDLARARLQHAGEFVRVGARTARWIPDDVPATLLAGVDVEPSPSLAPAPAAVVVGTQWRDAASDARELLSGRPSIVAALPLVVLLFMAISNPLISGNLAFIVAVVAFSRVLMQVAFLVAPISDPYRGVTVTATPDGLLLADQGRVALVGWGEVRLPNLGADRIAIQPYGTIRRRATNGEAFDDLVDAVREHGGRVLDSRARQANPAWRYVLGPLRTTAVLAAAAILVLQGDRANDMGGSSTVFVVYVATIFALTLPSIVRPILSFALVRPPRLDPAHRRAHGDLEDDEVWTIRDLRFGALVLVAAPLLVAGAVLLVTGDHQRGTYAAAAGLVALLVAQYALPALQQETGIAVGAAVASTVGGCMFVLSSAAHPDATRLVAGCIVGAIVVLLALARSADRSIVPLAQLSRSFLTVSFVAALAGGLVALQLVAQTRLPATGSAEAIAAEPGIAGTSLRGVRLADALGDVVRVTVTWDGDTPSVESPLFDDEGGSIARQRLVAVLREVAEEPGPRPRVREILMPTSWHGIASTHAVNELSESSARWPGAASDYLKRQSHRNDWTSHYYGSSERIVLSRAVSSDLLTVLRADPGTELDSDQAYSFHVIRHEIEHGMSARGSEPAWLTEATAELLSQWGGREREVMDAASFDTTYRKTMYGQGYEHWGRLLYSLLESCYMSPAVPGRFEDAARTLRDPDHLSQDLLADCIAEYNGIDRDGLPDLIADAGYDERAREELLARINREA